MTAGMGASHRLSPQIATALAASDRRIVITGAGGWLGLATLELLARALGDGFSARVRCFGSNARRLELRGGVSLEQRPLTELPALDSCPTFVLHLAFLTKDRVEGMDEDAYRTANRALSGIVLDHLSRIGATGVFVASSGAARSAHDTDAAHAMRLYGALKLDDEVAFADWARLNGQTAVITRIFNVAGPYINKHTAYALASFILDAQARRPIAVRAPHRVMRSFVAIREVMSLVFALLLAEDGAISTFDTGGDEMELADVAMAVSTTIGPVAIERAAIETPKVDSYLGDGERYRSLLARHRIEQVPFDRQIRETAEFLVAGGEGNG